MSVSIHLVDPIKLLSTGPSYDIKKKSSRTSTQLPSTYKGLYFTSPSTPPEITSFLTPTVDVGPVIVKPLYCWLFIEVKSSCPIEKRCVIRRMGGLCMW
ncbi:hypothetical protein LY76DRAFT_588706 [Colletotrichum caudatum]|nr:hypothetical protein LY76DRAFT_588706 [Colletotrichum caudatum]